VKIKTQFTATVAVFAVIILVVVVSLVRAGRQTQQLQKQIDIVHSLELRIRELSYLFNDYLLNAEVQQRTRWETRHSSLTRLVENFSADDPRIASMVREIGTNQVRLGKIFNEVSSTIETGLPAVGSSGYIAMIRVSWSRMEVQSQEMSFSASQIEQLLREQASLLQQRRVVLLFVLIGLFGAFLFVSYATVNRRILKALADLRAGAKVIGSGNLQFAFAEKKADEIGELSRAFNQMTADLRAVTASKAELEQEIHERRQVEEALRKSIASINKTEERLRLALAKAEEGDQLLAALMEHVPEGIIMVDAQLNVTRISHHGEELLGETRMAAIATEEDAQQGVFHADGTTPMAFTDQPLVRAVRGGEIINGTEMVLVNDGGERLPLLCSAGPIRNAAGDVVGGIAAWRDITDYKRAEEALRRSNQELEQFASVASHDLQEPLRAIVGFLQLLQSKYADRIDEQGRNYIERTVNAGHRMQSMIRQLLDLSRVSTKGSHFTSTDLNRIVQIVREDLQAILREKNAEIICAELPRLDVDAGQLQRLFQNLILNGLKYNRSARPVIEITNTVQGNFRRFSFRDNGIGISPEFHQRIFMIFQRLHTGGEFAGNGMGLALCKKIVERHGGTIWVESQPKEGSIFYFTLPAQVERCN
jgi:PAS domain S-box-containing protein